MLRDLERELVYVVVSALRVYADRGTLNDHVSNVAEGFVTKPRVDGDTAIKGCRMLRSPLVPRGLLRGTNITTT